jgi:hypothetical protein
VAFRVISNNSNRIECMGEYVTPQGGEVKRNLGYSGILAARDRKHGESHSLAPGAV